MSRPLTLLCLAALLAATPAWGKPKQKKTPASAPASAPASDPTPSSQASVLPRGAAPPISRLPVVAPRAKLGPLDSVRVRDSREAQDRSRKGTITVTVGTSPKGAAVYYGGKLLGTTPLSITAQRGSTPYDVVIRHKGYMTLRTRLMRKTTRGYFFKLTPAKLR